MLLYSLSSWPVAGAAIARGVAVAGPAGAEPGVPKSDLGSHSAPARHVTSAAIAVGAAVSGAAAADPGVRACRPRELRRPSDDAGPFRPSAVRAKPAGRAVVVSAAASPTVAPGRRRRCWPGPLLVPGDSRLHAQGHHAAAAAAAGFSLPRINGEAETAALGAAQGIPRRRLPAFSAPSQGKRGLPGSQSGIALPVQPQIKAADRAGAVFQLQSANAAFHRLRQLLSGPRRSLPGV